MLDLKFSFQLTKIKGYIDITGYKVIVDENVNPGRYGFRLIQENMKTHYFSSDEQIIVREWMKALMKATIGRDYSSTVLALLIFIVYANISQNLSSHHATYQRSPFLSLKQ